jgi:hypothetical protein
MIGLSEEGTGVGIERSLSPPGFRCVYIGARNDTVTYGSWSGFVFAVVGQLGVAAWYLRRRSPAARLAFASTTALALVGALGFYWDGNWQFGFMVGLFLSGPVGWLAGGRDPFAALAAGAAVFLAGFFSLLIGNVAACYVAVAVATTATQLAARAARPRPAR